MKLYQIEDAHQEAQYVCEQRNLRLLRRAINLAYAAHLSLLRFIIKKLA